MSEESRDCNACDQANTVDDMVQCDKCDMWYHYACAGVSAEIAKKEWNCGCKRTAKGEESDKVRAKSVKGVITMVGKAAQTHVGEVKH
uniref:Zinc finger PHD-type domain-containing protein n=1 Tax=Anopheles minimus TaxID=112268 RepID=A0A182W803_9DIPT